MTNEEYRTFWEKLLGRYPNFAPTMEQTKDWQRELQHKDPGLIEASVATIVTKYSSDVPKLPWILDNYRKIKDKRTKELSNNGKSPYEIRQEEIEELDRERANTIKMLKNTPGDRLRESVVKVVNKYHTLDLPEDKEIENWSPWLRAVVYCDIYGT